MRTIKNLLLSSILASLLTPGMTKGSIYVGPETTNVIVSIQNAACDAGNKLSFAWTITNTDKEPVFVYATFLKGPTASLEFDESSHLLTIWTSRFSKDDFAVHVYPRAKFIKLKPGAVLRGRFTHMLKRTPPIIGAKYLAFVVAFGQSIESVEDVLRKGDYFNPANPIVEWQKIARSAPIPLLNCTRM